jgi:hypothetical protein
MAKYGLEPRLRILEPLEGGTTASGRRLQFPSRDERQQLHCRLAPRTEEIGNAQGKRPPKIGLERIYLLTKRKRLHDNCH